MLEISFSFPKPPPEGKPRGSGGVTRRRLARVLAAALPVHGEAGGPAVAFEAVAAERMPERIWVSGERARWAVLERRSTEEGETWRGFESLQERAKAAAAEGEGRLTVYVRTTRRPSMR